MILYDGLADTADKYDAYILDLWGVLHNGIKPFDDTISCLEKFREHGKEVCLLSNSPGRITNITQQLAEMGITPDLYTALVTSGEVTFNKIENASDPDYQELGDRCFEIPHTTWQHGYISDEFTKIARVDTPQDASFMLATFLDGGTTMETYEEFIAAGIENTLTLICANPDRVVHHGDKLMLCPGSIADEYIARGGCVLWNGKPYGSVYQEAFNALSTRNILAIGDSLGTDIHGANDAEIDSLLCLGGIHRDDVIKNDAIDTQALESLVEEKGHRPTGYIRGFSW